MFKKTVPIFVFFALLSVVAYAQETKKAHKPNPQNDTLVLQTTKGQLHNILVNDYIDQTYHPKKFTITTPPKGKAEVQSDGGIDKLFYTPLPEGNDDDVLTYKICDSDGQCAEATVVIIKCIATQGAFPTVEKKVIYKGESLTYDFANVVIRPSKMPNRGTFIFNTDSTQVIYVPAKGVMGEDRFGFDTYSRKKLCGYTYQKGISVIVQVIPPDNENKPPLAVADLITIVGAKKTEFNVLDNDSDPEDNLHKKIGKLSKAKGGKIKYSSQGVITYTPSKDFYGTENLTYEVCDYNNACSTGTITIKVKKK